MVNVIGTDLTKNVHTLTLDGIDNLMETQHLIALVRAPLNMSMNMDKAYEDEPVPVGEGQVFTHTKEGLPTGNQDPTNPPSQTYGAAGIDGDLVPIKPGFEQFVTRMTGYRETTDYRMSDNKVTNLKKITSYTRNLAQKMAWTLNTAYRRPLTIAAQFGHAHVTTAASSSGLTQAAVNNLAGFHKLWVGGVETSVSSSNKIRATIKHSTDTYLVDVTAVTIGTRNDDDDLTAGTLTFTVLTGNAGYANGPILALSEGDPIVAKQASVLYRPGGKSSDLALTSADTLNLDMIINMAASMLSNGVQPDSTIGKIQAFGDFKAWAALMKNSDFRTIYRERMANEEFSGGTYIDTVNCRIWFGHDAPNTERADGLKVRSLIFCGDGAGIRSVYDKMDPRGTGFMGSDEPYIEVGPQYDIQFDPQTQIETIIRKPIDREADVISITMRSVIGATAQPDTISPYSENKFAAFKRLGALKFVA